VGQILHAMNYFKTSFSTLKKIAASGRFEDVAGFLVLARHATGLSVGDFGPYKLSGAGINSVHEKGGVSEETARGVLERLKAGGFIKTVSPETKRLFSHARWEVTQDELDLDLPHIFVDPPKTGGANSPMKRMRDTGMCKAYANVLQEVSDTELRLDALMLLLGVYRHTGMEAFGGLSPKCAFRKWEVKSQIANSRGVRWGAEPDEKTIAQAYRGFMAESMQHVDKALSLEKTEAARDDHLKHRFWNAWQNVKDKGLIYEAVALFDAPPESNEQARLLFSIRINDFHAGSITKTGDPSLLRSLEETYGTELAYYTPPDNERSEPEAMWITLPDKRGSIVGIWRPRFRPSSADVGAWIDKEKEGIGQTLQALSTVDSDS
jgi:hypothetical protein